MKPLKTQIQDTLHEMDALFESYYHWLAGQYDPETGGFYYARSSFDAPELEPDIESTAQALNILIRSELFDDLPSAMKQKLITFFQKKQDPESGFFYDRDPHMRLDDVMVGRALGYSTNALRRLGGKPLYPLPSQAVERPEYMQTPESYTEWLKSISMANSWRGCDRTQAPNHWISVMPEGEKEAFIEAGRTFLAEAQNPDTGLWGEGNRYIQISGTFKLNAFYNRFQLSMPNTDLIFKTIMTCLRTEVAADMCWVRNPVDLLSTFSLDVSDEDYAEFVRTTCSNMKQLLRPDGGFSRELKHSPKAPNVAQVKEGEFYPDMPIPVPLGRGLKEGDMNAGTQALLIRTLCYQMAGTQPKPLPNTSDFLQDISRIIPEA